MTDSRDFNKEYGDQPGRNYAYEFDGVVRDYLLRAVGPTLDPRGPSLEVGCFKGDMTAQILGVVQDLTVLEASSDLCEHVRHRFGRAIEVVCSTLETAEFPTGFANIFFVHTLEHTDDPVESLKRLGTWLAPGGRLIVAVPNGRALSRQIAVRMGLVAHETSITEAEASQGHRRTYTMDVLEYHLREAGLLTIDRGGLLVKALSNFQFDRASAAGIVDHRYYDACFQLGVIHPELCASIYAVCERRA